MRVSYTAHELYEYIRSFDLIKFWGGQNKWNTMMVSVSTDELTFTKGKKFCFIEAVNHSDKFSFGCCIAGNNFSCEIINGSDTVKDLIISSDCCGEAIRVVLEKNI